MIKNFKILSAVLLIIFLFTACGEQKKSPSEDVKFLAQAILYDDKDAMKKFYLSAAEVNLTQGYGDSINAEMGNIFNHQQSERVGAAMVNALKKVQFSVEDGKIDGDKATVSVTVDTFAKMNEQDFASQLPADFQVQSQDAQIETLANAMVNHISEMKMSGKDTFTIDCVYDEKKDMWVPINPKAFGFMLTSTIVNQ